LSVRDPSQAWRQAGVPTFMRIAQVAPVFESVPPKLYGGTERVVSYLTEALVKLGHDVTLYASGDSVTKARLRGVCRRALRLDHTSVEPCADHVYLAERVFQEAAQFDLVHSHIDYVAFPLLRRLRTPRVTTLHGRLDIPNLRNLYREFSDEPVISISDFQRCPLPCASWQATVYHGLPEDLYSFHEQPGKYLAFLGRASPEKRLDEAVRIARRAGLPLKIAAKVDKADRDYFQDAIKPLLNQTGVEFIGEIGERDKSEFLGNAMALLFPIDWPEPFGLVMIEALACGTPVIARERGSVPEIIDHGKTGFIFDDIEEAAWLVEQVPRLSRRCCREAFESRFTALRMAEDYLALYERLVSAGRTPKRTSLSKVEADNHACSPAMRTQEPEVSSDERHHPGPRRVLYPG
jgi:glycosyltransferase involved in cell wall biosynthesis